MGIKAAGVYPDEELAGAPASGWLRGWAAAMILGAFLVVAALIVAQGSRPGEVSGRYQFARASDNNIIVLDTKTGRIWQRFISSNSGPSDWTEQSNVPWLEKSGR